MSAKANPFKIGLFTLIAVALFVIGLLGFGARSFFVPKTMFETAILGDVSGLSVGSRVFLRGVPVGQVTRITFAWSAYPGSRSGTIIVDFEVDNALLPLPEGTDMNGALKLAIEKGMRATVKGQGVTGTSVLAVDRVDPAANPPPPIDFTPRYYYIPSSPGQFTRLLESIETSLGHLEELNFAAIGQGVTNALAGVHELTDKLNRIDLDAIGTNANGLLEEIRNLSARIQDTVGDVRKTLDGMRLDTVSKNANDLLVRLQGSNARLQLLLDNLDAVPYAQTFSDLRDALQNLSDVLVTLNQYPAGFIFGEPPLPAKGIESSRH